jgi:rare lipoprotein A (peptidoglycan hydrolase)
MKRRTVFLITAATVLQLYSVPLMKAEQATGLGSDEIRQEQTDLVLDSQQTQEPPGLCAAVDTVTATYYSRRFHGRKTANGDRYDRLAFTCAHKSLPFDTLLKVTNPNTNKSVIVRVNDRGPFKKHRTLDLSYAAALEIGMLHKGVMKVLMEIIPDDSVDAKLTKR